MNFRKRKRLCGSFFYWPRTAGSGRTGHKGAASRHWCCPCTCSAAVCVGSAARLRATGSGGAGGATGGDARDGEQRSGAGRCGTRQCWWVVRSPTGLVEAEDDDVGGVEKLGRHRTMVACGRRRWRSSRAAAGRRGGTAARQWWAGNVRWMAVRTEAIPTRTEIQTRTDSKEPNGK
jgi:hypothetical protein